MEWKMKEILNLIDLYRQSECLWNIKSPEYNNSDLKKAAWLGIAGMCGRDMAEIKKKIKNLRSAYVTEKKKVNRLRKSATSKESFYESHLFYFSEMQFLDSVVVLRKTQSTLEAQNDELDFEAEESTEDMLSVDLKPSHSSKRMRVTPIPSISPSISCSPPASPSISSPSNFRLRKILPKKDAKFDRAVDSIVASATEEENQIFKSFSRTIALQLKQLPPVEATKTMLEINQLITRKLINYMKASKALHTRSSIEHDPLHSDSIDESEIFL